MQKSSFNPNVDEFIEKYKELKSSARMGEYYGVNHRIILSFAKKIGFKNSDYNNYWRPNSNDEFIQNYNILKSSDKMAIVYNVCKETILKYAKRINYKNKYRNELNAEQVKYVCDNYYKKNSKDLAKELNVSISLITKVWADNGYKDKGYRLYYADFDYFKEITTPDRAYFLGILASDGCVYNRDNHVGMVAISLNIKDEEIIHNFNKYLNSNYKPQIRKGKYISLHINSDTLVNDLKKYNITNRKTKTYNPIILDDDLMWHYLRGYLDGDGSIYYSGKKPNLPSRWTITYCGNKDMMLAFKDFFEKHGIITKFKRDNRKNKYSMEFYYIRVMQNKSKKILLEKLYNNSENIRLERKYKKALDYLNCLECRLK